MEALMNALGIGGTVATVFIVLFLLLNVIGEICTKMDKIVPSFMKVISSIKKKRKEKQEKIKDQEDTLKAVKELLGEVNKHYSQDNITKRDEWMKNVNDTVTWVHTKADTYDSDIRQLREEFAGNRKIAEQLYVQNCRTIILNFAENLAKPDYRASRDSFKRAFKVYDEYEEFLREHSMENGEIEDAMFIIHEKHQQYLRENLFA